MKKVLKEKEFLVKRDKRLGGSPKMDPLESSLSLVILLSIVAFALWKMISPVISVSFLYTGLAVSIALSVEEIINEFNERKKDKT